MPTPLTVALFGTLDTKGAEYAFLRDRLRAAGLETLVVDASVLGEPAFTPDIGFAELLAAGGHDLAALRAAGDRGAAVAAAADSAAVLARRLFAEGRIHAVAALGGSAGTTIGTAAMRVLPLGVPKVMVSTLAAGDTRPYVGLSNVCMIPSVVDIAGLNSISRVIIAMAAAGIGGMLGIPPIPQDRVSKAIGLTMFGVTTPCVQAARAILERAGYECLVFHATGTGGRVMENLIRRRLLRRRVRCDHDRMGRRTGRRHTVGRAGAAGGRGAVRAPAGRQRRGAGHGQLRPAGHRPRALPRPAVPQAQSDRHPHADDA